MKTLAVKAPGLMVLVGLMLWCADACAQIAERRLYWDALDVEAYLNSDGVLDVIERHAMVFSGDWNGGERKFNVRHRQKLEFVGLERVDAHSGSLHQMQETSVPDDVDEFTWADRQTLRWRSRRPSDPPFANTRLIFVLHYKLSGILLKEDAQYRIDHDFAFPNRTGPIARFTLNLDMDSAWEPLGEFQKRYDAGPLEPGRSFVLNVPLRYSGTAAPAAIDTSRQPAIVAAAIAILGGLPLLVLAFFSRERSLGRFASVDASRIDGAWVENNILAHPAEVVGAAWDGRVGATEVVALIARMTAEGKLESSVEGNDAMKLSLKVDRSTLRGNEWSLVDGLFFEQRTETSTDAIQKHYKTKGFDPATVIKQGLEEEVKKVLPPGGARVGRLPGVALYLAAVLLLVWSAYSEPAFLGVAVAIVMVSLFLGAILQIPGWLFRSRMDWGEKAAALLMFPALFVSLGVAAFLGFYAGTDRVELPWTMAGALAALALSIANASINGMKSRQSREAIAFRKRLTTGRSFFLTELEKARPELQDSWYPWMLAFGLGRQVDVWFSHYATTTASTSSWDHTNRSSTSSSSTHTGSQGWSGGGGLSGGAGASGTWAAAAAGMAAGVATPSSSGGGGSSGSSSGGSSGGGGGGGW